MITVLKTTLAARLRKVVCERTDCLAVADSTGRRLTYGELLEEANFLSIWLTLSCAEERYIGVFLPSSVTAATANYGITLSGRVAVNLNFTAGPQNCRAAIELCGLRTILTSRAFLAKLGMEPYPEMAFLDDVPAVSAAEAVVAEVDPDSTVCVLFSSGSTGVPKGIELTHWNIIANAAGLASRIPPVEDDCMLGVLPFFHSFGYTFALWFPVLHGIRAVYHSNPTDCRIIGDIAQSHRATYFLSTPTFCQQYARKIERDQFASLKYILVGAEKLRHSVASEFSSHFGLELLAGYGCTELGPGVAINTPSESKPGSVGRPLEGVSVLIADPDTLQPLAPGVQGMILVNGPSRMSGYHRAPQLTASVIHEGFYITGDLGFVDEEGFLYVTDRIARFSKVAGEMVPHLPIEEAISDLTPSFVTGIADDRRGERLVLLYTNVDITADEIHNRLRDAALPPLWVPKKDDIHKVDAIPVLPSGKIDLRQARAVATGISAHLLE